MRLTDAAIAAAFERHGARYGGGRIVGSYAACWSDAHEAFENGSAPAFERLYSELRARWQVFRSRTWNPAPAARVERILRGLPPSLRRLRLSDLADASPRRLTAVWRAMGAVGVIKRTGDGPSLVALTKFLHFWNPRLFVIADRELVWGWVFGHAWLAEQVDRAQEALARRLPRSIAGDPQSGAEMGRYLAVLVWGAGVMRDNPSVMPAFLRHVRRHAGETVPPRVGAYEAAALEWLLLGLVDQPPAGVTVGETRARQLVRAAARARSQ
jgi:hypothetical protein